MRPEHLLNVVAARMSIFPDQPDHFVDWLRDHGESSFGLADRFMPRRIYGQYLQAQLQLAQVAGAEVLRDHIIALDVGTTHRLGCADGSHVDAASVVLATGNSPRGLPLPHHGVDVVETWQHDELAKIAPSEDVAIIGAGLSMVDAVLTLSANKHHGRIDVISRHGLLPLAHDASHDNAEIDVDAFERMALRQRLRHLRQWNAEHSSRNWQAMMRTLRDPGQRLWQSLSDMDQKRFLRHAVRYWDIHRHRIAPQVAQTLEAMRSAGQLVIHAARPLALKDSDGRAELAYLPRHCWTTQVRRFDRVINATGLDTRLDASTNPLLRSLLASGQVRQGPHGRGMDTASDGRLLDREGVAQRNLYTLGSPRVGSLWESIAIPDIRLQAADLAGRLLHASSLTAREGDRV